MKFSLCQLGVDKLTGSDVAIKLAEPDQRDILEMEYYNYLQLQADGYCFHHLKPVLELDCG